MTQGPAFPEEAPAGESTQQARTDPPARDSRAATAALTPPPASGESGATNSTWKVTPTPPGADPGATRASANSSEPTPTDDELVGTEEFVGRPEPGQTLFGRYRVEKLIGEGGMGSVWLVRHLELDALRALKLIVANNAFNPEAQARFRREARVMARLSHPNAVVVHDARITRGAAFIEMEYIRGESLNRLLKPGIPMPLDWTARILVQLSDVLQEAHEHKIVHRDLKPSNLMLVEGRPPGKEFLKVLDFGIAKLLEPDQETDLHTMTGSFMGTAQYSSPEQASGEAVDGRSDLYSVGVMLYEFLTGRRPFEGPLSRQLYDHLHTPPPSFSVRNPAVTVPPAVERVVLRCLAKKPADRPQTAHALAKEFLQALAECPGAAGPGGAIPREGARWPEASPPPRTESPDLPYVPVEPSPSQATTTEDADRVGYQPVSIDSTLVPGMYSQPQPAPPVLPPKKVPTDGLATEYPQAQPGVQVGRKAPWKGIALALCLAGIALVAAFFLVPRFFGHRLPPGYAAEKSDNLVNGWPRAIVRVSDESRVRFIRIEGGTFFMGDVEDQLALPQEELAERLRQAKAGGKTQVPAVPKSSAKGSDDDRPVHPVQLSDFYLQEHEVTNGEMKAYFQAKMIPKETWPKRWRAAYEAIKEAGRDADEYPAVGIPRAMAEDFARSVGGKLPTEAQWEYAARSQGKLNPYVWGTEHQNPKKNANLDSMETGPVGEIYTFAVSEFPNDRTEQGIRGLMGNVREWCRDRWAPYRDTGVTERDPEGPTSPEAGATDYVIRGGSFAYWADQTFTTRPRRPDPKDLRELTTKELTEDETASDLGFRVVIEWPPRP